MESDKAKKLDNTIKIVQEVLEKNKDNPEVKEAYEDIGKLARKRGLTN